MYPALHQQLSGIVAMAALLGGCALTPIDVPAVVSTNNAAVAQAIIATLRLALGTQNITLGPNALDPTPTISVLPPQLGNYETRSVVVPDMFDVMKRQNTCYLVRRTTGVAYRLQGVSCTTVAAAK